MTLEPDFGDFCYLPQEFETRVVPQFATLAGLGETSDFKTSLDLLFDDPGGDLVAGEGEKPLPNDLAHPPGAVAGAGLPYGVVLTDVRKQKLQKQQQLLRLREQQILRLRQQHQEQLRRKREEEQQQLFLHHLQQSQGPVGAREAAGDSPEGQTSPEEETGKCGLGEKRPRQGLSEDEEDDDQGSEEDEGDEDGVGLDGEDGDTSGGSHSAGGRVGDLSLVPCDSPRGDLSQQRQRGSHQQASQKVQGRVGGKGGSVPGPGGHSLGSGSGGSRRRGSTDADREHKRMKRLLRNRVSAQQARERKKVYLSELEGRVASLEQRNGELEERLSTLQRENFMLRQVVKNTTAAGNA